MRAAGAWAVDRNLLSKRVSNGVMRKLSHSVIAREEVGTKVREARGWRSCREVGNNRPATLIALSSIRSTKPYKIVEKQLQLARFKLIVRNTYYTLTCTSPLRSPLDPAWWIIAHQDVRT